MKPLDPAYTTIIRVAHIASKLGAQSKRPICGRLGTELLLVANYLETAGPDQEERLRLRISKLLRDVERNCGVNSDMDIVFLWLCPYLSLEVNAEIQYLPVAS